MITSKSRIDYRHEIINGSYNVVFLHSEGLKLFLLNELRLRKIKPGSPEYNLICDLINMIDAFYIEVVDRYKASKAPPRPAQIEKPKKIATCKWWQFHKWGPWKTNSVSDTTQYRHCKVCNKLQTKYREWL